MAVEETYPACNQSKYKQHFFYLATAFESVYTICNKELGETFRGHEIFLYVSALVVRSTLPMLKDRFCRGHLHISIDIKKG